MSDLSIDPLSAALASRSTSSNPVGRESTGTADFAQLLAQQLSQVTAGLADLDASTDGSNGSAQTPAGGLDISQLLALQLGQSATGLEMLGSSANSSANSSDDIFSALLSPSLSQAATPNMAQLEGLLTLRLLQAIERLLPSQPSAAAAPPAGLPAAGPISQTFHPGHTGIDVAVPVGTPLHATMSGQVTYAGWNNEGYGNLVIVENGRYRTYYAHLDSIPVTVGQKVETGAVVGLSGNTGHSTGPHVHYEVRVDGTPVSPTAAA